VDSDGPVLAEFGEAKMLHPMEVLQEISWKGKGIPRSGPEAISNLKKACDKGCTSSTGNL